MVVLASHEVMRPTTTTEAWNTTGLHVHRKSFLHMTFYWGHKTEILFSGWPGSSRSMYACALIFVFSLAVLVEFLNNYQFVKPGADSVASGLFKAALHVVRTGMSYMVMLALMSFNGGVFLAAIFGHAVGIWLFGKRASKKSGETDSQKFSDIATSKC